MGEKASLDEGRKERESLYIYIYGYKYNPNPIVIGNLGLLIWLDEEELQKELIGFWVWFCFDGLSLESDKTCGTSKNLRF